MAYFNPAPDGREQAGWNIASLQASLIFTFIHSAATCQAKGDIMGWYANLNVVRENINQELKKEERIELDNIESMLGLLNLRYLRYSRMIESSNKKVAEAVRPLFKKTRRMYHGITRRYSRRIMDLLKTSGYLPSKEDRSRLSF